MGNVITAPDQQGSMGQQSAIKIFCLNMRVEKLQPVAIKSCGQWVCAGQAHVAVLPNGWRI
jgi:hypothetical protein